MEQVEDMEERVNSERKRVAMLKKNVQLHDSLKTEDQVLRQSVVHVELHFFFFFVIYHPILNQNSLSNPPPLISFTTVLQTGYYVAFSGSQGDRSVFLVHR